MQSKIGETVAQDMNNIMESDEYNNLSLKDIVSFLTETSALYDQLGMPKNSEKILDITSGIIKEAQDKDDPKPKALSREELVEQLMAMLNQQDAESGGALTKELKRVTDTPLEGYTPPNAPTEVEQLITMLDEENEEDEESPPESHIRDIIPNKNEDELEDFDTLSAALQELDETSFDDEE